MSGETFSLSRAVELLSCRTAECRIVYESARGIRIELPFRADEAAMLKSVGRRANVAFSENCKWFGVAKE